MGESPFDSCWDRVDRVSSHRVALAEIWNEYIEDHPYDFALLHEGGGRPRTRGGTDQADARSVRTRVRRVLYNARACLDYIMWATSAFVTGQLPPPDEGTLQYPIYESVDAWTRNEYRLKQLAPHHRHMLLHMQPFNSDPDANYLGVVNRLARIDRHRRLTISRAYLAEMEPVIQVPAGSRTSLQWGQRVLVNGHAQEARIAVTPWVDRHQAGMPHPRRSESRPPSGGTRRCRHWVTAPLLGESVRERELHGTNAWRRHAGDGPRVRHGRVNDIEDAIDPDYVDHQGLPHVRPIRGVDGFRQVVHSARSGYADLTVEIADLIEGSDRAAARLVWSGRRRTGDYIQRHTLEVVRVEAGRAIEHWGGRS